MNLPELLELWNNGRSAAFLAKKYNVTKNTIFGVIARARIKNPELRATSKIRYYKKKVTLTKDKPVQFLPREAHVKPEIGWPIWMMKDAQCRYAILSDPTWRHLFCGEPIYKDTKYCEEHCRLIYPSRFIAQ